MNLFGTDGIRGIAGEDLSCEVAYSLGRALSETLPSGGEIGLGKDTRVSGDMLEAALIAGITSAGRNVVRFGVITTPGLSYLIRSLKLCGGVMVSASHNPYEYNGLKVFGPDGKKIPDEMEILISKMILDRISQGGMPGKNRNVGRIRQGEHLVEKYVEFLLNLPTQSFRGLKVLVDTANGSTSFFWKRVWGGLGARVESINSDPDGYNINLECGATHPESLSRRMKEGGFDAGFAFDGDGDRLIASDEKGDVLDGDHIMAQMAVDMKAKGILPKDTVVGTVMANLGLEIFLNQNGINLIRTPVGDRYVLEKMEEEGLNLGGEQSGHIIFRTVLPAGDGLVTSILLTDAIMCSGKRLSEVYGLIKKFPQVMRNIKASNPREVIRNPLVEDTVGKVKEFLGSQGRVVVRASGTEPLVRVMVESDDHEKVATCIEWLEEVVKKVI